MVPRTDGDQQLFRMGGTMKKSLRISLTALALAMLGVSAGANAGVVIGTTRVIFPEKQNEVSISLSNDGATPALVQAWLDDGDAGMAPEDVDVPFVLTPAMFRLDPGKGQTLRLMKTGPLPSSKVERLYWLNVLEVPPKAGDEAENRLQLALRTRIKLMYRPAGLEGSPEQAPARVLWSLVRDDAGQGHALVASNPTPYIVNFGSVSFSAGGQKHDAGAGHVLPGASTRFRLADFNGDKSASAVVNYSAINDWGSGVAGTSTLAGSGN